MVATACTTGGLPDYLESWEASTNNCLVVQVRCKRLAFVISDCILPVQAAWGRIITNVDFRRETSAYHLKHLWYMVVVIMLTWGCKETRQFRPRCKMSASLFLHPPLQQPAASA